VNLAKSVAMVIFNPNKMSLLTTNNEMIDYDSLKTEANDCLELTPSSP